MDLFYNYFIDAARIPKAIKTLTEPSLLVAILNNYNLNSIYKIHKPTTKVSTYVELYHRKKKIVTSRNQNF